MSHLGARPHILRAYRSGALSAAGGGALTSLGWDAESANPAKCMLVHSTSSNPELITIPDTGRYELYAQAVINNALLLAAAVLEIQIDAGGGFSARARDEKPASTTQSTTLRAFDLVDLSANNIVRVQFSTSGAAAALVTGEANTFVIVRRLL